MAKAKAKKKFKVIRNPELEQVVKGFVPVFGSHEDLHIVQQLFILHELLQGFDNQILRSGKNLTKKMKDALFLEGGLIHSITRRNLDF